MKMLFPFFVTLLTLTTYGAFSMKVIEEDDIDQLNPEDSGSQAKYEPLFIDERDDLGESNREARQRRRRPGGGFNNNNLRLGDRCQNLGNDTEGYCMNKKNCENSDGSERGTCGGRGLVCCILTKTCSHTTQRNNTRFQNMKFPNPDTGRSACTLTINRINKNICQMRFDFKTLQLSQPNEDGECDIDFFTVTGGTYASPIICGVNTGQHMYVDVDPDGGAVKVSVGRNGDPTIDRKFDIIVSQIECNSNFQAPRGCLQYFTETSGTVSSFNFNPNIEDIVRAGVKGPQNTRQLKNMEYGVCIKISNGYCGITWSRNITYGGQNSFTVSSNIRGLAEDLVGDPVSSSIAAACPNDYILIPGGITDKGVKNDRFCGAGFPNTVTTTLRPGVLYVVTDGNEDGDGFNRGFSLNYRQNIC